MNKLSHDQVLEMKELRQQGWTVRQLMAKFSVSSGTVQWHSKSYASFSPRKTKNYYQELSKRMREGKKHEPNLY